MARRRDVREVREKRIDLMLLRKHGAPRLSQRQWWFDDFTELLERSRKLRSDLKLVIVGNKTKCFQRCVEM